MKSTRRITVGLGQLDLDEYNPRHEPVQAERDAISILVADERTLPLAKHIAKHGALNPFQNIGVLPHPTLARRYIVVEGNRRVAALKMLNEPTKAPDDETRRIIERARANGTIPGGRVEVVLCSGEEEAHLWKTVQHQGQQGGIGTRQWNSKQKTRNAQALGNLIPTRSLSNSWPTRRIAGYSRKMIWTQSRSLPSRDSSRTLHSAVRWGLHHAPMHLKFMLTNRSSTAWPHSSSRTRSDEELKSIHAPMHQKSRPTQPA